MYSALKALERLKYYVREDLTSWELSPKRQAECPTEDEFLEGYPDQASIDLRLAHGFALVQFKTGKLAWVRAPSLDLPFVTPLEQDDDLLVLLTPQQPQDADA